MRSLHIVEYYLTTMLPKSRYQVIGLLSVLFVVLSGVYIGYLNEISPMLYPLSVEGIRLRAIVGWFLLVGIAIVLPSDDTLPSTAALAFVYIFLYVPTILYYIFDGGNLIFTLSTATATAIAVGLLRAIPPISFRRATGTPLTTAAALIIIAAMSLLLMLGLFLTNGIPSIDSLLYKNTYEIRAATKLPPFSGVGYIMNWVPKVILPFLAAYFWYKKWLRAMVVVGGFSVIIYMFSPQKLLIAALPFAGLVLLLSRCRRLLSGLTVVSISVIVVGYVLGMLTDTVTLAYLPSARLFFIQGRAQHLYVEFFNSGHPHLWLRTTPLNPVASPYPRPVSYLVSGELLRSPHNMNSGIFGDAYAHGGLLGVLALGPLLAGTGRLLDGIARQSDWRLILAASATPLFMLTQVGFTIAVATNGISFAIALGAAFTSSATNRD